MQKITLLAFGGLVLAGCMSLEERLASSDIRVRNEAERELVFNAYKCGAPKSERLAAIKRVKNQNFLEYLVMSQSWGWGWRTCGSVESPALLAA